MVSTITDRVSGAVAGAQVQRIGYGRVRLIPSSGVDTIVAAGSPTVRSWIAFQEFIMRPTGANTGAVTVNPDTIGAKSLVMPNGVTALPAGTLTGNQDVEFYYNETLGKCVMLGPF